MGRDDRLLSRLYTRGRSPPPRRPGRPPYGIVPALWLVGLALLALSSAIVAVVALILAIRPSPLAAELRARGILAAGETPWLYHDHSPHADGSSGCVAAGDRLIRFDGPVETASVVLTGATITYHLGDRAWVIVRNGDTELVCPFGLGEGAQDFADVLRAAATRADRARWGPADPRLMR